MRIFLLTVLIISSSIAQAAACLDVFSDATQTTPPGLILPTFSTSSSTSSTIGSNLAVPSGDYGDITLDANGTLNMGTTDGIYRINSLSLGKNSNSYFVPGDYFIDTLFMDQGADIIVSGTGTVRIYSNNITIGKNADISNGTVYLVLISYGDMVLDQGVRIDGAVYAEGTVTADKNSIVNGSIHASSLSLDSRVDVTYDTSYISSAAFNGMCDDTTATSLDYISITTDGSALTCTSETLTLRACADATCTTVATEDVVVSLASTGSASWSTNPLTIPANSSAGVTVTLTDRSAETVTVSISGSTPSAANGYQCSNTSCDITFTNSGYLLSLPNHSSCAGSTLSIQAVNLADNGVSCAPAYTGNQDVNFAFTYSSPATGTVIPDLNASPMASAGVIQTRTINFDGTASASLPFSYDDAGRVSVTVSDAGDNGLSPATVDTVVSPAKLLVFTNEANNACTGPDYGNCSAFKTAGIVGSASSEFDLNIAGACADDTVTPNFQLSNIALSANLVAPASGNNASLGTTIADITSNGQATITQTVSEVGAFSITATPGLYLGEAIPSATSATIGRFIPHHFNLSDNSPMLADASCDFTYQDQATTFATGLAPEITITAVNSAGATTTNYGGDGITNNDFWYLNSADFSGRTYTNQATPYPGSLTATLGAVTTAGHTNYDGVFTITFADDTVTHNKAAVTPQTTNDAPFTAQVLLTLEAASLTDSDGVYFDSDSDGIADDYASTTIDGTDIRWGRWSLDNGFGSELQAILMNATAQYFDGNQFVTATTDNCTPPVSLTLSDYSGNLNAGETTATQAAISSGILPITLSAPGAGNTGSVLLTITTPDWLQYDYDGDGTLDNAQGTATFGIYQGRDAIIIKRQTY